MLNRVRDALFGYALRATSPSDRVRAAVIGLAVQRKPVKIKPGSELWEASERARVAGERREPFTSSE